MKAKGGSGWTEPAFSFTDAQQKEIRRAFPGGFPEAKKTAFLRRMAGAMTKLATDKGERATDPRAARGRAKKVAKKLAEAASEIRKMTETERDVLDLAVSGDPLVLTDLAETLEKAATGFRMASDGHALDPAEKVAGPNAASMFVAAQAAVAWRETFGPEPSADPASPFTAVADAIFDAASLPRLGKEAIRTAIKGPPKSRKRK